MVAQLIIQKITKKKAVYCTVERKNGRTYMRGYVRRLR